MIILPDHASAVVAVHRCSRLFGTRQVIRAAVGVIRGPGVMDGDPGEGPQDPHRLDRLPAAPGVHHEQGVLLGAGAVHPVQPARHPEPGLIEPGDIAGGDVPADPLREAVQAACGLRGARSLPSL